MNRRLNYNYKLAFPSSTSSVMNWKSLFSFIVVAQAYSAEALHCCPLTSSNSSTSGIFRLESAQRNDDDTIYCLSVVKSQLRRSMLMFFRFLGMKIAQVRSVAMWVMANSVFCPNAHSMFRIKMDIFSIWMGIFVATRQ